MLIENITKVTLTFGAALVVSGSVRAETTQRPVVPLQPLSLNFVLDEAQNVVLDRYVELGRFSVERENDAEQVVLHGVEHPIPAHAVLVFAAYAQSGTSTSLRWSCIAVDTVGECVSKNGEILDFRRGDRSMEVVVQARSLAEPEIYAFVERHRALQHALRVTPTETLVDASARRPDDR